MLARLLKKRREKMEHCISTEDQHFSLSKLKTDTKVTDLPLEILSKIFQNLSTTELLQKVAHVSKHFHQVTKSPDSHRHISIYIRDKSEGASNFLRHATLIESLNIRIEYKNCSLIGNKIKNDPQTQHELDPLMESLVRHHQQLRHITILSIDYDIDEPQFIHKHAFITRQCFAIMAQSTWWPKLKTLILPIHNRRDYNEQSNKIDFQFDNALNLLKLSGNIRRLSISGLSRAEESSLIMSCRDLKSLTINQYYKQSEIIPFLQKIKSTVEELDFGYNLYGEWLYPLVSKFSNLNILKQTNNPLYDCWRYEKDENKVLDGRQHFVDDFSDGELLQVDYRNEGIVDIPPFKAFQNLRNLTSINLSIWCDLLLDELWGTVKMPNVTELKVIVYSPSKMCPTLVIFLADMFPNLETYWLVSDKHVRAIVVCFGALFQMPRKIKDFRLTERRRKSNKYTLPKLTLKDLLSNLGLYWPQLNCFVWCVEAKLEKYLFKYAKTLLVKSANLKVIGTHKTLFVKPSVTKQEILSLAMTTEFTKIKIVKA